MKSYDTSDLLVFSHLRWDFVFQRPQHLMTRFAKHRRVFYFEEPVFGVSDFPTIHLRETKDNVNIVIPHLPANIKSEEVEGCLKELVDELIFSENLHDFTLWYYTPMALPFTRHLNPNSILFDCMDELSLFKGAPQSLIDLESELLQKAHLVFTGGESLYQAKKHRHHNIHPFPSSIEYDHFKKARDHKNDPEDQAHIPHPRVGFYGVVDERFDIELLKKMAQLKPEMQFIILGPVVKIDPATLPKMQNIHYLGRKEYSELPQYLSGWDCAMMPFALNESTKYISPTKTPEFLAAGKPVVSTSITDVINPYKHKDLVHIADEAEHFVSCIEKAMKEKVEDKDWTTKVDSFLKGNSWEMTFNKIAALELKLKDEAPTSIFSFPTFETEGQLAISGA
jgi:glycosyltransferase involved in cell wall biosynthesis